MSFKTEIREAIEKLKLSDMLRADRVTRIAAAIVKMQCDIADLSEKARLLEMRSCSVCKRPLRIFEMLDVTGRMVCRGCIAGSQYDRRAGAAETPRTKC